MQHWIGVGGEGVSTTYVTGCSSLTDLVEHKMFLQFLILPLALEKKEYPLFKFDKDDKKK